MAGIKGATLLILFLIVGNMLLNLSFNVTFLCLVIFLLHFQVSNRGILWLAVFLHSPSHS